MTPACTTRILSPYESGHLAQSDARLFRPGGRELTERAIALAHLCPGARILDLGCGAGDTVRSLRAQHFEAVGIDPADDSSPQETSEPGPVTRLVGRAETLPFADGALHAILAECSLSLVDDRDRALAECARVLADGGILMISDLYARHPEAIAAVRSLRGSCAAGILVREELETSLANAGFLVNVWEDHSRALRECAARFLFEHGSLDGLWSCGGESSAATQAAVRTVRAGYFLLIATRRNRSREKGPGKL
ncbi:MAG: DVU_1556 family methyltransferase [Acidobacteriaceae bacterium]